MRNHVPAFLVLGWHKTVSFALKLTFKLQRIHICNLFSFPVFANDAFFVEITSLSWEIPEEFTQDFSNYSRNSTRVWKRKIFLSRALQKPAWKSDNMKCKYIVLHWSARRNSSKNVITYTWSQINFKLRMIR